MNDTRRHVTNHLLAQLPPDIVPLIIAGRVPSSIPILHQLACTLELYSDAWWMILEELDRGESLEDAMDTFHVVYRKVMGGRQRVLPLALREPWVDENVDSYIARHFAHLR